MSAWARMAVMSYVKRDLDVWRYCMARYFTLCERIGGTVLAKRCVKHLFKRCIAEQVSQMMELVS